MFALNCLSLTSKLLQLITSAIHVTLTDKEKKEKYPRLRKPKVFAT